MSVIYMRCPQCGRWCVAEHKGIIRGLADRFLKGWNNGVEDAVDVGGVIGESLGFGNEKVANVTGVIGVLGGGAVGGYTGVVRGLKNAVAGDKFQFECPDCHSKWSTDDEDDNEERLLLKEQEIASWREGFLEVDKSARKDLLQRLQRALNEDDNTEVAKAVLCDMIAATHYYLGNIPKALESINQSIRLFDDASSHVIKGMIEIESKQSPYEVLRDLVYLKHEPQSYYFGIQQLQDAFAGQEQKYVSSFMDIPADKRRFIYLASELAYLPNSYLVLPYNNLPRGIEFRGCVPALNTLYVMHPYKPDCYLHAKNFETELFRDEMHEFIHIMECLGAQSIQFKDVRTAKKEQEKQKDRSGNAKVEYAGNSVAGGASSNNSGQYQSDLLDEFGTGKTFDLSQEIKPYVPKDVVWYDNREEWRRSCVSRLEGRLRHDVYKVLTKSSELISEAQKNAINADIAAMNAHIEGSYEGFDSFSEKTEASHLWECEVEFYPLSEYKGAKVVQVSDDMLPASTSSKSNWLVWILGAVVAVLVAVILFLVL